MNPSICLMALEVLKECSQVMKNNHTSTVLLIKAITKIIKNKYNNNKIK